MSWIFPSSSNRPLLCKAHVCIGEISHDCFPANSLAQTQNPLDMLSRRKGSFFVTRQCRRCGFVASMRDRLLFWLKCLVICFVQRIMHPGTVRQTQWLDPFNQGQRCHRWLREEDMLKRWVIFTFFVQYKSREFIQQLNKHYWALFWRISVCRGVRKKQFSRTYAGPFFC